MDAFSWVTVHIFAAPFNSRQQPADRKNTETDKVEQNPPITEPEHDFLTPLSQTFGSRSTAAIDGNEKRNSWFNLEI